jgi:hypothetical protein
MAAVLVAAGAGGCGADAEPGRAHEPHPRLDVEIGR